MGLLFVLAACNTAPTPTTGLESQAAGRYVVVLKDNAAPGGHAANKSHAAEIARGFGLAADKTYGSALFGFAASIPEGRLNALKRDARVAYVEADQVVSVAAQTTPTGVKRIFADKNPNLTINGVDDKRIDVDVAVIDTGIDLQHTDLNVYRSTDCSGGSPRRGKCGSGGDDDNGHGTHVAGSVGALDNGVGVVGVAPGARLWAVKVLSRSSSGYTSWIIAGIDYVTANASQIEVANMSLGCQCQSDAQDAAIAKSVKAGVT